MLMTLLVPGGTTATPLTGFLRAAPEGHGPLSAPQTLVCLLSVPSSPVLLKVTQAPPSLGLCPGSGGWWGVLPASRPLGCGLLTTCCPPPLGPGSERLLGDGD